MLAQPGPPLALALGFPWPGQDSQSGARGFSPSFVQKKEQQQEKREGERRVCRGAHVDVLMAVAEMFYSTGVLQRGAMPTG